MKSTKKILLFYFIILFLSNTPVTKEIEICRIGGKEHICGKGKDNSGFVDNINVEFFTYCGAIEEEDGYSCLCIRETTSGIWNNYLEAYDDLDVASYHTNYLIYKTSENTDPSKKKIYNKCFIGRDCSDIKNKSLCLDATQCEYKDGECSAKCSINNSKNSCLKDTCRWNTEKYYCTNSSILPVFKLISIIILSLFLI